MASFPTRERGLKCLVICSLNASESVVPHAGTWIEIMYGGRRRCNVADVVPHAGTWIEIITVKKQKMAHWVVPHAGTWIEIPHRSG